MAAEQAGLQQPLTADSLARWVVESNSQLQAIQAAAEAAAFRIEPAASLPDPMLSYGLAPLTHNAEHGLNQRLDISQKFPWPGTLRARESAARFEAKATDKQLLALRLQVIAQAKAAFAEWHYIHRALAIHHQSRQLLDELVDTTAARYSAGQALKQELLQAQLERSSLDNQLLRLQRIRSSLQARINALLNRAVSSPLPAATAMPIQALRLELQPLQQRALAGHPELAALDATLAANDSRIVLAEKAFYPDVQLGVGYNSLWDNADKRAVVNVSINLPLNRSKRRAELGFARANLRRAEWSLIDRRAELMADIAEAYAQVKEAEAMVLLHQQQLVPLAEEYLAAAITDYQSGSGAFLNVISAEQRQLSSQLSLARTQADYRRRLAELERWVGASLPVELNQQVSTSVFSATALSLHNAELTGILP